MITKLRKLCCHLGLLHGTRIPPTANQAFKHLDHYYELGDQVYSDPREPEKRPLWKWKATTNLQFLGSMLVFESVEIHQKNTQIDRGFRDFQHLNRSKSKWVKNSSPFRRNVRNRISGLIPLTSKYIPPVWFGILGLFLGSRKTPNLGGGHPQTFSKRDLLMFCHLPSSISLTSSSRPSKQFRFLWNSTGRPPGVRIFQQILSGFFKKLLAAKANRRNNPQKMSQKEKRRTTWMSREVRKRLVNGS